MCERCRTSRSTASSISARCFSVSFELRLSVSAPNRIIDSGVRSSCDTFAISAPRNFIVSASRLRPRIARYAPRAVKTSAATLTQMLK